MLLANNRYFWDAKQEYSVPRLINLMVDPKEREPVNPKNLHTWVYSHTAGMIAEFQASSKQEELIPMGAPLDFVPEAVKEKE